jgi:hypothetical protein
MFTSGSESNSMDHSSGDVYIDYDVYYIEDDCNIHDVYFWDTFNIHGKCNNHDNIHDVYYCDTFNIHDVYYWDTLTIHDVYKHDKCNILDVNIHDSVRGPSYVLEV